MKIIDHALPYLDQINTSTGRYYRTPAGILYPSVSSILGAAPSPELEKWRKRVGAAEADRISRISSTRGTRIHQCCENYILGKENIFSTFDFLEKPMFQNMIPHLDKFDEVHALETRLFSNKLRVAGTVDSIVKINGQMWVVDYKTSKHFKHAIDIPSYFLQCSAYAVCFYEQTGIVVPNIRIIMTTTDYGVLVFDEKVKDWIGKFMELRNTMLK